MQSPWYYPTSRHTDEADACEPTDDFQPLIDACTRYPGTRIKDRYALQAIRALFATRQYARCIRYFDEDFRTFPDTNLFKRMSMDNVAGCWTHLGDTEKANEYFAQTDNLGSIRSDDPTAYLAHYNPNSPELMSYIQSCANDSARFCALKPVAEIADLGRGAPKQIPPEPPGLRFTLLPADGLALVGPTDRSQRQLASGSPLFAYLKKFARSDTDYWNELIGTLALREANYARAVAYFAQVSEDYIQSLNIYKDGYLNRDPFYAYPDRWRKSDIGGWFEVTTYSCSQYLPMNKLELARRILSLQQQVRSGSTPDERGLALLKYAIGRRNSFEECWALTQYWRGTNVGLFQPLLDWDSLSGYIKNYQQVLYDYSQSMEHEKTRALYQQEVERALAMLQTDEGKATAAYILGNLATVVKQYGHTSVAQRIKTSCDNWRHWL